VDKKGNWHVINHAYDTNQFTHCGNSTLSAHSFSNDEGKTWHSKVTRSRAVACDFEGSF
jgi:hypothetical protein